MSLNTSYLIIKLTSSNKLTFQNYQNKLQSILTNCHIQYKKQINPIKRQRFYILRSPHVYKKSIETYETRIFSVQFLFFIKNYSMYLRLFYIIKFLTYNLPLNVNIIFKLQNNVQTNLL